MLLHATHQRQEIVRLWKDLLYWAGANAAANWLSFRMTVAGLLAYVLAQLFTLPQGYWAVFSAIIVTQASVGGSVKATTDRLIGTIGGAVAGAAVAFSVPHESVLSLGVALLIALAPLTLAAALRPNYRIAPLTAVIVLLTPGAQQLGPLGSALYRIFEITLGSFVGLGVSLALLPARAHALVISAASGTLGYLADLLGDWLAVLAGGGDRSRIAQLLIDTRTGIARLEKRGGRRTSGATNLSDAGIRPGSINSQHLSLAQRHSHDRARGNRALARTDRCASPPSDRTSFASRTVLLAQVCGRAA